MKAAYAQTVPNKSAEPKRKGVKSKAAAAKPGKKGKKAAPRKQEWEGDDDEDDDADESQVTETSRDDMSASDSEGDENGGDSEEFEDLPPPDARALSARDPKSDNISADVQVCTALTVTSCGLPHDRF